MKYDKIQLKKYYNLKHNAYLEIFSPFLINDKKQPDLPLAIICPGGGYGFVSHPEKDPVAIAFMKEGYVSATLTYTVKPDIAKEEILFPTPHLELMASIDYLRKNAKKYHINPNQIVLVGFSAGGHLIASYSYLYKNKKYLDLLNVKEQNVKPNYLVLAYPVISFVEPTHGGTRNNLINDDEALFDLLSIEKNIDDDYPTTYIWNTLEDHAVPPLNSNIFADALMKKGIKHMFHQYAHGEHGLSLIDKNTIFDKKQREQLSDVASWFFEAINYLEKMMNK